jgi:hypothetical protein
MSAWLLFSLPPRPDSILSRNQEKLLRELAFTSLAIGEEHIETKRI